MFSQKTKVLNFATFHMSHTSDKHKVKFDEKDEQNKSETYEIAKMLAKFKPTIICVEESRNETDKLNLDYTNFLKNKIDEIMFDGEVRLIAYEVGKMARVKRIYGIDDREFSIYSYNLTDVLKNQVDTVTAQNYQKLVIRDIEEMENFSTFNKLKKMNSKDFLDKVLNVNADNLTYVSTKGKFEGADEASKFYHRNLRIYSNLNQIPVTKDDRVFIIMGAAHTAILNEFMKRSPKYELVDVTKYLQ